MTRVSRQEMRRKNADLQRHIDGVIADAKAVRDAAAKAAREAEQADRATEGTVTHETLAALELGTFVIRDQFGWRRVLKVNARSVTVPSLIKAGWTDTVRFEKIREVRS